MMSENYLWVIYTTEAILAIFGFMFMPRLLRRFGNYSVAIVLLLIQIVCLLGLTMYQNVIAASLFMTCNLIVITFLSFSFDVFLEGYSSNANTGKIRGIYMTCVNLAWVLSPFITGLILINGDYWKIYFSSFLLLIPIFFITRVALPGFKDSLYKNSNPFGTFVQVWKNKDVYYIFMCAFLLQFFYAWMTIYTPIYLHTNLGLPWSSIGIILGIMLLPFVFIQFPAGRLADNKLGEKEILSVGFIIMALATISMYFITGGNVIVWALVLFATRVGAAAVEIMCDVYFFKKVDNKDANLISFFRMSRPLGYIVGSLVATIILSVNGFGMRSLFLFLGFLMIFGLRYSLAIKDTR